MAIDVASIDFGSGAEWEQITIPVPTYHQDFPTSISGGSENQNVAHTDVYSVILTDITPGVYRVKGWVYSSNAHRFHFPNTESNKDEFSYTPQWALRLKNDTGINFFHSVPDGVAGYYTTLHYKEEVFIVPEIASQFNLWLYDYSYYALGNHNNPGLILEKMVD